MNKTKTIQAPTYSKEIQMQAQVVVDPIMRPTVLGRPWEARGKNGWYLKLRVKPMNHEIKRTCWLNIPKALWHSKDKFLVAYGFTNSLLLDLHLRVRSYVNEGDILDMVVIPRETEFTRAGRNVKEGDFELYLKSFTKLEA